MIDFRRFHKFFRTSDGKNKEDSEKIYAVWKAITECPDYAIAEAIKELEVEE